MKVITVVIFVMLILSSVAVHCYAQGDRMLRRVENRQFFRTKAVKASENNRTIPQQVTHPNPVYGIELLVPRGKGSGYAGGWHDIDINERNDLKIDKLSEEVKDVILTQLLNTFFAIPSKELFQYNNPTNNDTDKRDTDKRFLGNDIEGAMESYREGFYAGWISRLKQFNENERQSSVDLGVSISLGEVKRFKKLAWQGNNPDFFIQGYSSGKDAAIFLLNQAVYYHHSKTISNSRLSSDELRNVSEKTPPFEAILFLKKVIAVKESRDVDKLEKIRLYVQKIEDESREEEARENESSHQEPKTDIRSDSASDENGSK